MLFSASPSYAVSLEPKLLDEESYGESFTAIADLSDGTYILLQYVFTNAGFGDGKGACRGLVVRPGETGQNSAVRVDRDEWSYAAKGNRLKVDKCVLSSAGGETQFKVKTEDLAIDLTLSAKLRRTRPPGHRIKVDDDEFYEAEVLIPWAAAQATIKAKSGRATLKGMGYLDHTRSNTRVPKIASRWLRFRGFKGGAEGTKRMLIELRYDPEGRVSGWSWTEGDARPKRVSLRGAKFQATRSAATLKLKLGTLQTSDLIYTYRPAKAWGMLGRLAKPWVGDPKIRTFHATLTLSDGQTVTGIFEQAQIDD